MSLTTDPEDPRLGRGTDKEPGPQNAAYLILSEAERAKGFVRPVRLSYRHAGIAGPRWPLRDLTEQEQERYAGSGYVKYEEYPPDDRPSLGRFWTQAQLGSIGKGCGTVTTMAQAIAETYALRPDFYGATFCVGCGMHRPVGANGEFVWTDDGTRVGT
jgi:hypothetical protein